MNMTEIPMRLLQRGDEGSLKQIAPPCQDFAKIKSFHLAWHLPIVNCFRPGIVNRTEAVEDLLTISF